MINTKLGDLVYYKMEDYSQIIIDLVEEADEVLMDKYYTEKLGALSYKVSLVLDIINPELKEDINILEELNKELELKIIQNKN